jgi:hypothetical protein
VLDEIQYSHVKNEGLGFSVEIHSYSAPLPHFLFIEVLHLKFEPTFLLARTLAGYYSSML